MGSGPTSAVRPLPAPLARWAAPRCWSEPSPAGAAPSPASLPTASPARPSRAETIPGMPPSPARRTQVREEAERVGGREIRGAGREHAGIRDPNSGRRHGLAGLRGGGGTAQPGQGPHRCSSSSLQPPTAAGSAPTSPRATRARARARSAAGPRRRTGAAGGSGGRAPPSPRSRSAAWRKPSRDRSTWAPRSGGSWRLPCSSRRSRLVPQEAGPSRPRLAGATRVGSSTLVFLKMNRLLSLVGAVGSLGD